MKYSKTTLMELSHKYKSILKKCAFFNAAILLSVAIILPAGATTITEDLNLSGEEEEKHYDWKVNVGTYYPIPGHLANGMVIEVEEKGQFDEAFRLQKS